MDPEIRNTIFAVASFALGGVIGSFLNVCVYRLPRGESVITPRSRCPKCGESIAWYDNIPILSWLILGARCRHCRVFISWQYPLVEAITATLFLVIFWRFGMVFATPVYMLLAAGLVLCTFIDLTTWMIPDEVTLPGVPIGILCALVAMYWPESGFHILGPGWLPRVFDAIIGVEVGGGVIFLTDKAARLLVRKKGMGLGDVKLLAMLGAFFGWSGVIMILVIAAFAGSAIGLLMVLLTRTKGGEGGEEKAEKVTFGGWYGCPGTILVTMIAESIQLLVAKRPEEDEFDEEDEEFDEMTLQGHYIPFGPYLCLAGIVVMLFGQRLLDAYVAISMPNLVAGQGL